MTINKQLKKCVLTKVEPLIMRIQWGSAWKVHLERNLTPAGSGWVSVRLVFVLEFYLGGVG